MFQQPISLLQKEITWRITGCFEIFTKYSMFWCNHFQDLGNYGSNRMNSWTKTWGNLYWFLQYGIHLKKKKKLNIIPNLLCCIILSQLKKRWGRTEDKNIISSGSLSYLLSAIRQHNPNFLFTIWKSNHWVSSFYLFFFVKKEHKRTRIDKLWF